MTARPLTALLIALGVLAAASPGHAADDPVVSGKKVSEWVADLKSGSTSKAVPAAEALGRAGEAANDALPALVQALGGKDTYLAYTVRNQLGKFGPAGAAALVEAAKQTDAAVGPAAVRVLRKEFPDESEKAGYGSVRRDIEGMKKLDATAELKGTSWLLTGASSATGGMTSTGESESGASVVSLAFTDAGAEWTSLAPFLPKAGKGTYTADAKQTPARVELKTGDAVYKGIYKVWKEQGREHAKGLVYMRLEVAGADEDYPAKFVDGLKFPKGSKNVSLFFTRVK